MGVIGTIKSWFRRGVARMTGNTEDNRARWPRAWDDERLLRYQRNQKLFDGQHEAVFCSGGFAWETPEEREYIATNLLWALTDLLVSREIGDGVAVSVPSQPVTDEWLRAWAQHSLADQVLIDVVTDSSVLGDGFAKVSWDADTRRLVVDRVDPGLVSVELSPLDARKAEAIEIGQVLAVRAGDRVQRYLWIERHELRRANGITSSWVVNLLYAVSDEDQNQADLGPVRYDPEKDRVPLATVPALAGLPDEAATGIGELLVRHITNRPSRSRYWGNSDYESLLSLQGSINNRLTQRDKVLDGCVEPFVSIPGSHVEADPTTGKLRPVDLSKHKVFMREDIEGDTQGVQIAVWDASLVACKEQLEDHYQQLAITAGVDLSALLARLDGAGAQISGRAIALMQTRTQATVKARQRRRIPEYQALFAIVTKLAALLGESLASKPEGAKIVGVDAEDVSLDLGDGLPTDAQADLDAEVEKLAAGIQSKRGAIKNLNGYSDDDADKLLDEIAAEGGGRAVPSQPADTTPSDMHAETNLDEAHVQESPVTEAAR